MTRITRQTWTDDQVNLLKSLLSKGASPARASVLLKRPMLAVQNKARQLGTPFPDRRIKQPKREPAIARDAPVHEGS
jgi:hypothetical protein